MHFQENEGRHNFNNRLNMCFGLKKKRSESRDRLPGDFFCKSFFISIGLVDVGRSKANCICITIAISIAKADTECLQIDLEMSMSLRISKFYDLFLDYSFGQQMLSAHSRMTYYHGQPRTSDVLPMMWSHRPRHDMRIPINCPRIH